jgi:hypothetical protein
VVLISAFTVVCALLVVAGAAKLRSPEPARDALALVRARVPVAAVRALGLGEVALGAFAVLWPSAVAATAVAIAYGGFCAFVVTLIRAEERPTGCGCFGDADAGAGTAHALLNAAACGVAVLAATAPPPGIGWVFARPVAIAAPLALGVATAVLAGYLAFTAFPRAWRAYGAGSSR